MSAPVERDERWRVMLWEFHGHPYDLDDDDGELQCRACGLDFKRQSVEHLRRELRQIQLTGKPRTQAVALAARAALEREVGA